ncbi:hypothetical protein BGW39_007028 [Mortierella sp. 14UC]|nr:hypothetical protein BGW39_007028 [Mortierella sp. 14UC]
MSSSTMVSLSPFPSSMYNSPYLRDFSPIDSRRRQPPAWSIPSPPSNSRSLPDSSSSSSTRPHYDQHHHDNFTIHLPPPSTLSPPTTASTLSSYTSSPYDTPSTAAAAAAAAFKHISPFSMASASWASPPGSHYHTPSPVSRRESFIPRARLFSSSSPHTSDLPWESSSSQQQHHSRSDSNQRPDKRFQPLHPGQRQHSTLTTTSANSSSSMPLMASMAEDRLSLHRLSPPDDTEDSLNTNNKRNSRSSFSSDRSLYESLPPLHHHHQYQHHRSATSLTATTTGVEGSFSDRSRISTSESGTSLIPPPLQRVLHLASKDSSDYPLDSASNDSKSFSSSLPLVVKDHSKKWTSTESVYNRKVLSARGTPKGPLPMNVQISLLSSVLRHDPFNCPIRRTTQVWEAISREQGVRARTCARRYDNIIQASIAGRERPVGTEEQIAAKKKLLDQLFVMMNQPQALVRMQKKKRYRSEEADRQLLLETIRLNPFAQKMGQVAKAWEDVRDALKMQVHARQCIRRVNRMIKPYQLRERMYHGNIPDEMKEENDELIKQVIQMMQASGQGGSLEDDDDEDAGQSQDEDDSASDSDDQEHESHQDRSRHSRDTKTQRGNDDEIDEGADSIALRPSTAAMNVSLSPRSPALSLAQSPQTVATTPAASEPPLLASSEPTIPAHRSTRRLRLSGQSSLGHSHNSNKRSLVDRSSDEMTGVIPSPHHPFESEFKPQRLWGSHPYSKERLSRTSRGTHSQRASRSSSLQSDLHHRPTKYTRSSSRDLLGDSVGVSRDRLMALQGSSTAAGGESESRQYYYDQQNNVYTQSNTNNTQHHHHHSQPMTDGQIAISSAQQQVQLQGQAAKQLYRAILGEFQVVQQYLGKMEDQRARDKERQTEMGYLMDKLQFQLQQQQQSIQDLQAQLQHQQQHQQGMRAAAGQGHGQGQEHHGQGQEHHGQSPQQFDHRRASQSNDYSSPPSFSSSMNVPDQQQQQQQRPKSREDQE